MRMNWNIGFDPTGAAEWAASMQDAKPVILDSETTDLRGYVCEIAILDSASGDLLVDTIINPLAPMNEGARRIHRITDAEMIGAPTFEAVWPQIAEATAGRVTLIYNAEFDTGVIDRELLRMTPYPLDGGFADARQVQCLMERRLQWTGDRYGLKLNGGHRAAGDCRKALELLQEMGGWV
jgi:DNA polymerase III epsilon subunit-like protein